MRSSLAMMLALTALMAVTSAARAQVPSLDLRSFDPSSDPRPGIYYEPATSPETFDANVALWTSYAYRPVTLREPSTEEVAFTVLEHRVAGNLVAGMGLFERAAVGVDLPYVLWQSGDDPVPRATNVLGGYSLPEQALGDVKLLGKVTVIRPTNEEFGGFSMALHERFGLPTGDEQSYLGEGHVTSETRLLLQYAFLAIDVYGAAGFEARAEEERFGCAAVPLPAEGQDDSCRTRFGHQVPWGLGLAVKPQAFGLDETGNSAWFVEAFGTLPASPEVPFTNAKVSTAQIAAGARTGLPQDLMLLVGFDAALIGGIGSPPFRGHVQLSWAPRDHDQDGDGVPDDLDLCPEDLKEDHDGFEDEDGCPDWDNDDDGVPDDSDRCPDEREDEDGYEDDDGCADPDNDGDGILDIDDACPDVAGIRSDDPEQRGCPDFDPDDDGIEKDADRCPDEPEDIDQHEDEDGCPDPDNDGDGILDIDDVCPDTEGVTYDDGDADGCPDADEDGIADRDDACPEEAGEPASDEEPDREHGCPVEEPE